MDFAVAHYAGEVIYNVLEKNTDKLHGDITNLLKTSRMDLVKTLFTDPRFLPDNSQPKPSDTRRPRASVRARPSLAVDMVFREHLDRWVEDLNKTNTRYVRIIKPNANKLPLEFDSGCRNARVHSDSHCETCCSKTFQGVLHPIQACGLGGQPSDLI